MGRKNRKVSNETKIEYARRCCENRISQSEALVSMIENYIYYYNNKRYQRRFGVLTPIEKYNSYLLAV